MSALFSVDRPPRLRIDRDRISVPGGSSVRTEVITVMNEGGGILKGTVFTDVPWIIIPNFKIETPFILPFRIEITPEAMDELKTIQWTGNIRELKNVVERLVILCENPITASAVKEYT